MIVSDIISRVKRTFGDESGAQITDEDILRWINDGQNEIAQLHDLLEAEATTYTTAGQVDYSLPENMVSLKSVYLDGAKLQNLSTEQFDEYMTNNPGSVGCVYTSWGNRITLYPAPGSKSKLVLRFSCFPAPVDSLTAELNIPLRYHNRLVEYVMQQAYELDENFEAMSVKQTQFANSMSQTLGDEQWDERAEYPYVTVRSEDAW